MLSWLTAFVAITAVVALALSGTFEPQSLTQSLTAGSSRPHSKQLWSDTHTCQPPPANPAINQSIRTRAINQIIGAPLTLPPPGSKVLVTGAAGFIGSHVAEFLVDHFPDLTVIGVDDLSGGFMENLPTHPNFIFVKGDLKNDSMIEELFDNHAPFYAVYHLAAYAAEGLSHFIRKFNYRNNLVSSAALLNEALIHGTKVFVFTSSIAAYGAGHSPMIESDECDPEDPYGVAKYAFELDLKAASRMWPEMSYVIFRPHNVYGSRQNIVDKYRNVLGIFLSAIRRNESLPIFGDGLQTRAFTYIDDVAPIIALSPFLPQAKNEIFNVGSDEPATLLTLAQSVTQAMNVEEKIHFLPARLEVTHASALHDKIKCVFGLGQSVDLQTGIQSIVEWTKTKHHFQPVEFDQVEVIDQMPTSWITQKMIANQRKPKHNQSINQSIKQTKSK